MIFKSENDWLQFAQGIAISVAVLFSGGNFVSILLAVFLFLLGLYYAFGKKITIYDSYFTYSTFFSKLKFEIDEIKFLEFKSGFLGNSFFILVLKDNKKMKGFCTGHNIEKLKKIAISKRIKVN